MSVPTCFQRGSARGRDPWAIRAFLDTIQTEEGRPFNMSTVARLANTYPQVAQETIRGMRNHGRVLAVLEILGCPREYLYGASRPKVA